MAKMEEFVVTGIYLSINKTMVIGLSDSLAAKLKSAIKEIKNGVYEVVREFHLKNGDRFLVDPKMISKKDVKLVEKGTEYDAAEEKLPIDERIKKLRTTSQLESFIKSEMAKYELPNELDVTNAMRKKAIEMWFDLDGVDLDEYALENCEEMTFVVGMSDSEKKQAIINYLITK